MSNIYQAPESDLNNNNPVDDTYGSVEKAIQGDYEFSIGNVLSEAWERTNGVKWQFQLAFLYYFLILIGIGIVMGIGIGIMTSITQDPSLLLIANFGLQIAVNLIAMPMVMGTVIMGIRRSMDKDISAGYVFNYFSATIPLFATLALMYLMMIIGFALLVIPGIYLMVAYYMAMPLVVEKGMSPWKAMETSRKAITHRWFSVFGFFFVLGIIMMLSMLTLGIALIWTLPMMVIAYSILYRNMFGVEASTLAD